MKRMWKDVLFFVGTFAIAGLISQVIFNARNVNAYVTNPIQQKANASSHSEFLDVYNEDNVAHEVGDVVVFVSTATNGTTGLSVSTTTTEGNPLVAGVIVENDIAAGSWGKIQTRGYISAVNVTGTCIVGGSLITSTTGEVAISSETSASSNYVEGVFGVSLTADSDGSCPAILK